MTNTLPMPPKGDPELYAKAQALVKEAWPRMFRKKGGHSKSKGGALGYVLQAVLKNKDVWTLKDLDDYQLQTIIYQAHKRIEKKHE